VPSPKSAIKREVGISSGKPVPETVSPPIVAISTPVEEPTSSEASPPAVVTTSVTTVKIVPKTTSAPVETPKRVEAALELIPVATPIVLPEPVVEAPKPVVLNTARQNLEAALRPPTDDDEHAMRRKAEAETLTGPAPSADAEQTEDTTVTSSDVVRDRKRRNSPKPITTASLPATPSTSSPARFDSNPPEAVPTREEALASRARREAQPDPFEGYKPPPAETVSLAEPAKKTSSKWQIAVAIGGIGLVMGAVTFALLRNDLTGNDATSAGAIPLPNASSASPTTSTPSVPPMTSAVVIPKNGLPMTPENLQKVFGQSDPKNYRDNPEWKEGDPFFCFCQLPQQPVVDVTSCKICQ
jgi:hypothetical protein